MPCAIKWPGVIRPGTVINDVAAHEDMLTTRCAAAGDATAKQDLTKGRRIGDRTCEKDLHGPADAALQVASEGGGTICYGASDPTVADVLARHGIWEFGRFASR